jgi:hypothetical protein
VVKTLNMARVRTTKELAQRIELDYFKRPHPVRHWMRLLSVGAMALAAVWLIVEAIPGDQSVYMPGPVSQAHALFGHQCTQCHSSTGRAIYWRDVSDAACLKCHDGPVHHQNQLRLIGTDQGELVASNCASCHVEHKGQPRLTQMSDRHCTQCHEDLQTKGAAAHPPLCLVTNHRVERKISRFPSVHPEFAVLRVKRQDTAQIKLNHEVHLKPNLTGPDGPTQLTCTDCHTLDVKGAYMAPIEYEKHCMACHLLDYDPRWRLAPRNTPEVKRALRQRRFAEYAAQHPDQFPVAPHETPEVVRAFLQLKYADETSTGVKAPSAHAPSDLRLLSRLKYSALSMPARTRVDQLVQTAEDRLYQTKKRGCQECHPIEAVSRQPSAVSRASSDSSSPPPIVATSIPSRWLPHSTFNHKAHRLVSCVACHTQTPKSRETNDVLLPNVQSCAECHRATGGARSNCTECHLYHDKSRERQRNNPLTIQQLLTGVASSSGE